MGQISATACTDCHNECLATAPVPRESFEGTNDEWEVQNFIKTHRAPDGGEDGWKTWNFNVFKLPVEALMPLSQALLSALSIPTKFSIPSMKLRRLLIGVRELMLRNNVMYHNYYHALDVMQAAFVFVESFRASAYLDDLEIAAFLLAALCHDLDHPGLNNDYHIKKGLPLAIRYNDSSVLENHHAAKMFQLLEDVRMSILENVEPWQKKRFREICTGAILATDMSVHFTLLEQFKTCLANGSSEEEARFARLEREDPFSERRESKGGSLPEFNAFLSANERAFLINVLLHTVDICNPCRQWPVAQHWNDLIQEEFFLQGDLEKSEGLVVSPNMDRERTNVINSALGFIDFIITPLFAAVTEAMPRVKVCLMNLEDNRKKLNAIRIERSSETKSPDDKKWDKRERDFEGLISASFKIRTTIS
mmetsp:Transcript_5836/g.8013  ORF Transcript_5836/g.8013 Transcript_5836/m.8013 type:complete len:422 (+) Transcript_5836:123-1388(+)